MSMIICSKCGKEAAAAHRRARECVPCRLRGQTAWRAKNRDKVSAYNRAYGQKAKRELVDALGGVCECCGEDELAFLTLDHIGGVVPNNHYTPSGYRVAGKNLLREIKAEGFPRDKYRILCFNCNMATRHGRSCPHELARKEAI